MIKNKHTMNIAEIKKFLQKKGFKISKIKKIHIHSELKSIYLTAIFAIALIGVFFILPKTANYTAKLINSPDFIENSSKADFEKAFNGISKGLSIDPNVDLEVNEKNLFDDVIRLNETPTNSVRLPASTLKQLFQDTKYNLKDIRKNKKVKPVEIGLLPKEMKQIESVKARKELFIKIVLPLILEENNNIKLDRKRLFVILNKNNNNKVEKEWLKKKFKQYGVVNNDLSTLKVRMDEIPVSIAIAQAAKETGWGTSRFAIDGNALFGQWTWNGDGIKPAGADSNDTHKVMKFNVLKASVRAYQRNINTHSGYKDFRRARAIQRDNDEKLNSLELVGYLDQYAATGVEYTKVLKKIIIQNSLIDFDDAKLLPTSKKLRSLI